MTAEELSGREGHQPGLGETLVFDEPGRPSIAVAEGMNPGDIQVGEDRLG